MSSMPKERVLLHPEPVGINRIVCGAKSNSAVAATNSNYAVRLHISLTSEDNIILSPGSSVACRGPQVVDLLHLK